MPTLEWPAPPTTPREYAGRLVEVGLGCEVKSLLEHTRRGVRLVASHDFPDPEQARTRLGGRPLMPADAPWPRTRTGRPLSFVAQLDCATIAALLPDEPLPDSGLLSFFYDGAEQTAWGFDPDQSDCWSVAHHAGDAELVLRDHPAALPRWGRFQPGAMSPRTEWTFPPVRSAIVDRVVPGEAWLAYAAVLGEVLDADELASGSAHRVLGHPDPIQDDMQVECQLASNGVYTGDGSHAGDPRAATLADGALQWRLLLQVDSAEDLGMTWGDAGRLYWWIRDDALRAHRWDTSWLVLQCY